MRFSSRLAMVLVALSLWGGLAYLHGLQREHETRQQLAVRCQLQQAVSLPNLAITGAARYLRHYSLADLATPFQDYPTGLDHFPAAFAFAPPDYSDLPSAIAWGRALAQPLREKQ